jgi:hypothetical protein
MEWTRSETLGLALVQCTTCHGLGLRRVKRGKEAPCNCVLRSIFRACFRRFRRCIEKEKQVSLCTLSFTGGRAQSMTWGRKNEEFIADFLLMVRRLLSDDEYRIFRFHYLLGADWRLCTLRLKIDRGEFFHYLYKLEARLGKAFREVEPYGLYPLDEYFYGRTREAGALTPLPEGLVPFREGPAPLRPPMAA